MAQAGDILGRLVTHPADDVLVNEQLDLRQPFVRGHLAHIDDGAPGNAADLADALPPFPFKLLGSLAVQALPDQCSSQRPQSSQGGEGIKAKSFVHCLTFRRKKLLPAEVDKFTTVAVASKSEGNLTRSLRFRRVGLTFFPILQERFQ